MIIDCHCHAGSSGPPGGQWDTSALFPRYMQRAAQCGIDRTVLFSVFHPHYAVANHAIARLVNAHPDRFCGFAFVHPVRDKGRIYSMVGRAVEQYGFSGIKVHRHDGPITPEICETASAFSIPVLYDIMGVTQDMDFLGTKYPEVFFIIPHMGSFGDDWKAQTSCVEKLLRYPNLYADTSGVRRFDLLLHAVRKTAAKQIIFGTDGPWLHPGIEMDKIHALNLSEQEEWLILGGNLLRLLPSNHSCNGLMNPVSAFV